MKLLICAIILCAYFFEGKAQNTNIPQDRVWYITDFGAKGDGKTLNTEAIQKAIDVCTEAGGGTVRITPGGYITGTLFLKDGVNLYLDANARLIGSKNKQDYQATLNPEAITESGFGESGSFLIYAENAKYISIEGKGEINGSGDAFWEEEMLSTMVRKPKEWRPRALVSFVNCQFINIRDAFFTDSPCFTLWPIGCDDIKIEGVTIRNPINGPNTDGIDIDCCRRVTISNCNIVGGDDAIAIKSDGGRLGENRPCENIVVSNCVLSSPPACAVRIGYEGDSPIRNCVFSNLTMFDSNHGIDIISILPLRDFAFSLSKGTRVENIQFDNIVMQNIKQPIYLWLGNEREDVESSVQMSNIRISNLIASNAGDSYIGGMHEKNIENVFLSNISIALNRKISQKSEFYTNVWNSENPFAIYAKNVTGLHIDGFSVDFSHAKGPWKHALYCQDSKGIVVSKVSTNSGNEDFNLISQIGASNSSLRILDCIRENNVKLFSANDNSEISSSGCEIISLQ